MADPTSTTVQRNQYGFAPELKEYANQMLGDASNLTDLENNPYMVYMGDRVAQFSPLQQLSYDNAALMQGSGQLKDATATAGLASLGALNTGYTYNPLNNPYIAPSTANLNYTANTYGGAGAGTVNQASADAYAADSYGGASAAAPTAATSQGYTAEKATGDTASQAKLDQTKIPTAVGQATTYNPTLEYYQMGDPSKVSTKSFTDTGTAASYMSPYMQNVVDIQQREAQRQADIAGTQQQGAATKAGAFGGGRDAIMRAEAARNLALQKGDIQAQGQQAAYQQAQQQFNAEQGYGLQGQIANQQAGLTQGQQNLGANLGVQQLGTQTGLQTSLANLSNLQQAEMANKALTGQYAMTQAQMDQQAGMQTSAQKQQAALQNAAAMSQASQFGSAASNQAQLANRAAENQMAQYNAGNIQQAEIQNTALASQANKSYADAYNQAQLANAAARNQMQQYNASNIQQAGLQGSASKNQAAQFNAGQNLASAQNTAQYGQAAANLNAQQGQFGAGLGLQGLQTAMTGATTLGNLGNTQYNQNMGINQMQNQLGAQQQQQVQNDLNNQYQDFQGSQNYPYKQIGFMSDILRGAPTTNAGSTMYNYQAPPSTLSQIGGLGATALGAFGAFNKANGGMVGRYAKGGLVRSRPQGLVALAIHSMA